MKVSRERAAGRSPAGGLCQGFSVAASGASFQGASGAAAGPVWVPATVGDEEAASSEAVEAAPARPVCFISAGRRPRTCHPAARATGA